MRCLILIIWQSAFLILYLIFNFTRLINMAPEVSNMAGSSHRWEHLLEYLFVEYNN